jgi:tetratricopeptide (TPR) repeat protein
MMFDQGPLLPPPPADLVAPNLNRRQANPKPPEPARSRQLTTLGDRLFRAGNFKKAEERYTQAVRAAPDLALPRVRLGQIAMIRGQYSTAANRLREAETAEPGWILNAPDIQALYGEPTDFATNVARLESYLQAHPDDRDAWLVLGAEWFLSGRAHKAADVFKRLNDPNRKPDVALAAFLDASNQAKPDRAEAAKVPEPPRPEPPR